MSISWYIVCLLHNCLIQGLQHLELVAMKMRRGVCDKYFNAAKSKKIFCQLTFHWPNQVTWTCSTSRQWQIQINNVSGIRIIRIVVKNPTDFKTMHPINTHTKHTCSHMYYTHKSIEKQRAYYDNL